MIQRFTIGNPIETEAVVMDLPEETGSPAAALAAAAGDAFVSAVSGAAAGAADCDAVGETAAADSVSGCASPDGGGTGYEIRLPLGEDDLVYGLGETVRGMNKRGWVYRSWCSDEPYHLEEKHSLYAAHNFLLITSRERSFGLFVDTPGAVTFDVGYSRPDELRIRLQEPDARLYLITGEDARGVAKEFRRLIGPSYIPPKWAFGYGQSRWSYATREQVREVADAYRAADIPLDMIYLDIDYMERYKDFTVDEEAFPDFPGLVREMKGRGIRLIPIIDAGIRAEEGYDVCEEGLAKGYFCTKEDGSVLTAAVWPGRSYFPDFLNPEVRKWFGGLYQRLLDQGIEGFWNDMNEPSIFYTEDHLREVFEEIEQYRGRNLDVSSFFAFKDLVAGIDNNPADYARFWHEYHGERVRHDRVHNLYGFNMTRAAGEALERLRPGERTLLFSRASYIGAHRYAGVWTGDNRSWWSHILLNLQQLPGLNLCGFLYTGADMGGFSADATEDLVMRWLGVSIFTPLLRNHAACGTRRQELTAFERTEDFRNLVGLRYALVPYLTSEFLKAALQDEMMMEPLSFEWPQDERARQAEDQLLVGGSIMIAPVYTQNAKGRMVYLPEDMRLVRFRSASDYDLEDLPAGDHYVRAALNEIPVFLRRGKSLPLAKPALHVEDINWEDLTVLSCGEQPEPYRMVRYEDLERTGG